MSDDPMTMPFGKHFGMRVDRLPIDYCRWLVKSVSLKGALRDGIYKRLKIEPPESPTPAPERTKENIVKIERHDRGNWRPDLDAIRCPICGFEFVHFGDPEKVRGYDSGTETDYPMTTATRHPGYDWRGDGIVIPCYCEEGHLFDLILGHHKGNTYLTYYPKREQSLDDIQRERDDFRKRFEAMAPTELP